MAAPMGAGFSAYELTQVDTGQSFYTTHATQEEILNANANLKRAGETLRYFPKGSFCQPSLHSDCG